MVSGAVNIGTFAVVHCFVLVFFKSTAVQTLFVSFFYLSIRVAISLPMQRLCRSRGE